jgi:ABC-type antimicrobial peptide transport system ATPase subunit
MHSIIVFQSLSSSQCTQFLYSQYIQSLSVTALHHWPPFSALITVLQSVHSITVRFMSSSQCTPLLSSSERIQSLYAVNYCTQSVHSIIVIQSVHSITVRSITCDVITVLFCTTASDDSAYHFAWSAHHCTSRYIHIQAIDDHGITLPFT